MTDLSFTLVTDGSSDQVLIPILTWLLQRLGVDGLIQGQWPDLRQLPQPPRTLSDRIKAATALNPCQLLFVHRDAEGMEATARREEIDEAIRECGAVLTPIACVVPVRMQEAWLLFDQIALRRAAGNPNGRQSLTMPRPAELEELQDPKSVLHELLREASGLQGRRRRRFPVHTVARRVADFIEDFSPLLELSAFTVLESDLRNIVRDNQWG
jgi:hypothetical protein